MARHAARRFGSWSTGRAVALAAFLVGGTAEAAGFRLEVGAGIVQSDYDVGFEAGLGPLDFQVQSDGAVGGSGPLYSAGLWADGVFWRDLSLGLEYLRGRTEGELDLGVRGLGFRGRLNADLELETQSLFLDLAWRLNEGAVHPYVGVGLGASWLDGRIKTEGRTDVGGGLGVDVVDFDEDTFAPSGQAFAGFDYDLGRYAYVGLVGRYFLIDGRLFGREEVLRELSAQAKPGLRF
jgi:hypothetical protein